jgi:hypothetical protein
LLGYPGVVVIAEPTSMESLVAAAMTKAVRS